MWSDKHNLNKCNDCGRSDIPHKAFGFCRTCYDRSKNYVWQKNYSEKHRGEILRYKKGWNAANPSSIKKAKAKWSKKNRDKCRRYIKSWRKKNKAPFCIICGETRCTEWSHIIPVSNNGPTATWNLIPLCPTHHRAFDSNLLTDEEFAMISDYVHTANEKMKEPGFRGAIIGKESASPSL